jgi:hypothetical protein
MHDERMAHVPKQAQVLADGHARLICPLEHMRSPIPSPTAHITKGIAESPYAPPARQESRSTSALHVKGRCWCAAFTYFMDALYNIRTHGAMNTSRAHALHLTSTTYAAALM